MIEKLKTINPYDETEIDMDTNSVAGLVYENTPLIQKINELVDAVNVLQAAVAILEEHAHPTAKTEPTDPYAEQRKWIGSLVEYKLGDLFLYGILTDIKDGYTLPFVIDGASYTDDCWLPDESVIYHKTKGGNNE